MGEARELKRSAVFVFDDGQLRIKLEGYGVANGWGEFAFHDACAPLRTRAEAAEASVAQMMEALEPFAEVADDFDADGRDMADEVGIYANTAGDYRRARAALSTSPSNYRERVRREAFEEAAKVADDFEARWDAQWRAEHKGSSHLEGKSDGAGEIASAIRTLGDSNANG